MNLFLQKTAKRYRREWIFKNVDYQFISGGKYAITGPNGSGKSTLMKVLSGHLTPSKGKVEFLMKDKKLSEDAVYRHISYAAPYIDLIEEFTLREALEFHSRFKPFADGLNVEEVEKLLGFHKSSDKQIRHFSSGMKQRLKLVLALCSKSDLLLFDEPTTNLDKQGVDWYLSLAERFIGDRTVVVASNVEMDYQFCGEIINILDYK